MQNCCFILHGCCGPRTESRVEWIVQYDPPCEIADYAHRVGRAARAGQAGHALLFLLPSERSFLEVLELKGVKNLEALSLAHTLTRAGELCPSVTAECKAGFKNKGEAFAAEIQRRLEDEVIEDDAQTKADQKSMRRKGQPRSQEPCGKLLLMARQAFLSYVRAYPTKEKDVRHIFCSRALHVGHVARSFALKEPPKATVNRVANVNNLENGFDKEKRNASLTFRSMVNDSSEPSKKKHKKNDPPKKYVSKNAGNSGSIDTGKARMVLMEQAAKLQQVGMNSL
jgi:ATP-dependent RNA helicase DDX31/DBP7